MNERATRAALQLDEAIDGGGYPPLVDVATLDAMRLLQADAAAAAREPMPGAREVRLRVLEGIVEDQVAQLDRMASRGRRRRGAGLGRRALVHGMVALVACGCTVAVAQTSTPPGDAVRSVARTAAHALDLPAPALTADGNRHDARPEGPARGDASNARHEGGRASARDAANGAPRPPHAKDRRPDRAAHGTGSEGMPDAPRAGRDPQARPPIEPAPQGTQEPGGEPGAQQPGQPAQPVQPPPGQGPGSPAPGGQQPGPRPPAGQQPDGPRPPLGNQPPPGGQQPQPS